jgi:hypothetical protein
VLAVAILVQTQQVILTIAAVAEIFVLAEIAAVALAVS